MEIKAVTTPKQLRHFIEMPYRLYCNDTFWVPPLRGEQRKMFDARKNAMLNHCDYIYFLAYDQNKPIGRVATYIDFHFNEHWNDRVGFFGAYECINSIEVSHALLDAAREWLKDKNMEIMRGPINLESQNWGFIIEGFDFPPVLMSPYNPNYYNEQMTEFGLSKAKDLESFKGETTGYQLPQRFERHFKTLQEKYNITVRTAEKKYLERDVKIITELTNQSITGNWGFTPVSEEEAATIAKEIKLIIDPSVVFIMESRGEPIGYSIALPDVNVILKKLNGRLFPFGIFKLLYGLKKINSYRLWALGIKKGFQRRGLDTFLYVYTYQVLKPRGGCLEANYVLEDNFAMRDAIIKLGLKLVRRYRIYEMALV